MAFTPIGVKAISRGSSEATPPDIVESRYFDAEGITATLPCRGAAIPSGSNRFVPIGPVVCLAGKPPANGCDPFRINKLEQNMLENFIQKTPILRFVARPSRSLLTPRILSIPQVSS